MSLEQPPWHAFIAIFGSPKRTSLLLHNEFMKVDSGEGLSAGILEAIFWIYRRRGFHVAVMSSVVRQNVLERKLYRAVASCFSSSTA